MTTSDILSDLKNKSFYKIKKLTGIGQLNLELEQTDYLQKIVEFGNKHLLKSFQLRLVMDEVQKKLAITTDKQQSVDINSPLDVISKEVKQDDRLCKQVYYTLLSMYTKNPINLAINAPTGEGKSYPVKKVAELFPQSDVLFLSAMSDKALFHRPGVLVIKNEKGEYQPVQDKIVEIDSEIEDKDCEIAGTNNSDLKKGLKSQIKSLQDEKKELTKNAIKLIDLNHKALIFLDTPNHTLLEAIMSLLSHDHHEVEYHFVDNFR